MALGFENLVYKAEGAMSHAGLPVLYAEITCVLALIMIVLTAISRQPATVQGPAGRWYRFVGSSVQSVFRYPKVLLALRVALVLIFLLIVLAGLFGTPLAQRNLATTLTWTVWWTSVVAVVFFAGTLWCAVCPWDTLASWLAKQRIWRQRNTPYSLGLKVPRMFRNIWPATILFVVLTWFELGWGMTLSPLGTAVLSLLFVLGATASMLLFERKAFCQHICPVGRTLGAYGKMSLVSIKPVDTQVCAGCSTLECYHGSDTIEPCPTHITIGKAKEKSYCVACGNCLYSCPHENLRWTARSPMEETRDITRINHSETWFLIVLLALTLFHGITMLPFWEDTVNIVAGAVGDSGRLLLTFSLFMVATIAVTGALYYLAVWASTTIRGAGSVRQAYRLTAVSLLPLALTYHVAHNFTHLFRETRGLGSVLVNPFGTNALPLSMHEVHQRHMSPLVSDSVIFVLQALLLIAGCWAALKIANRRLDSLRTEVQASQGMAVNSISSKLPVFGFIFLVVMFCLWLLMQPMIMRH